MFEICARKRFWNIICVKYVWNMCVKKRSGKNVRANYVNILSEKKAVCFGSLRNNPSRCTHVTRIVFVHALTMCTLRYVILCLCYVVICCAVRRCAALWYGVLCNYDMMWCAAVHYAMLTHSVTQCGATICCATQLVHAPHYYGMRC